VDEQVRAKKSSGTGQLAKNLENQKKQTREDIRKKESAENRLVREADAAAQARNYN